MRFDSWLTLSGSTMDLNTITSAPTREADFGGRLGRPTTFSTYRDPEGRFLLRYPEGWSVEGGPPVQVRSNRLPLGAKVDVLRGPDVASERLLAVLTGATGLLVEGKGLPGPPPQVRGRLVTRDGIFTVRALAFPMVDSLVVLSTAIAPVSTQDLERYGRAVLAAVRREFRVPASGPSG